MRKKNNSWMDDLTVNVSHNDGDSLESGVFDFTTCSLETFTISFIDIPLWDNGRGITWELCGETIREGIMVLRLLYGIWMKPMWVDGMEKVVEKNDDQ